MNLLNRLRVVQAGGNFAILQVVEDHAGCSVIAALRLVFGLAKPCPSGLMTNPYRGTGRLGAIPSDPPWRTEAQGLSLFNEPPLSTNLFSTKQRD